MGREWRWSKGGLGVCSEREGDDIEDIFLTHNMALMAFWSWGSSVVKRPGLALSSELFLQCPSQLDLSWMPGHPSCPSWTRLLQPRTCRTFQGAGQVCCWHHNSGPQCLSLVSKQGMTVTSGFFHFSSVQLLKIVSKIFLLSGLESFAMTDWAYSTLLINTVCSGILRFSVSLGCLPVLRDPRRKRKWIQSSKCWLEQGLGCLGHELWLAAEPHRWGRLNLCPP